MTVRVKIRKEVLSVKVILKVKVRARRPPHKWLVK